MSYALAVSNGNGKNGDETNAVVDGKDVIGRLAFNFAEMAQIKNTVLHVGGAYTTGTIPPGAATGAVRTEGRGLQFFAATAVYSYCVECTIGFQRVELFGIAALSGW